ncbi:ABC transporter substrate-binding protein [Treponema sp. OMZ 840]|uniref:ABC transporter substrate-binding protein n=1 Tax=Treponema sp. OMZ 840 TaxID=244313 RepID=UPI003D89CA15
MKNKVYLFFFIVLALMGQNIFAAGSKAIDAKKYNVALSVVWEGNTYAVQSREEFYAEADRQRAAGKIGNVYYLNADGSAEKQVSDLEDLYTRKVDILIIQPVNPPAVSDIIKKFYQRGTIVIPCVSPLATDSYTLSMVSDDMAFGRTGAEFLVKKLEGKGNIIALDGIDGLSVAINRWKGAMEVFNKYPNIKILGKVYADWDYAKGKAATENLLAAFPKIDGVWSSGGDMTRGAIEAFLEAGRPLVPMMGEDANGFLKAWKRVAGKDKFAAVGCSMPTYFFADALKIGVDILEGKSAVGKDLKKDNILQVYQITDANLDKYVREDLADSFWANTKMDEATLQKVYGNK